MTADTNPYNCTKPGNLFVGYRDTRTKIIHGIEHGLSFAILGGRRCGKTSILMQIYRDLENETSKYFKIVPRYIDIQSLSRITPDFLFREIYERATEGLNVSSWQTDNKGDNYRNFLTFLETSRDELEKAFGPNWLVVLLVDELDAAAFYLDDDRFFVNLRNLLMVSAFNEHFRMIASGVGQLAGLIRSGSSPLNNLRALYLGILSSSDARELREAGFEKRFDLETEIEIDKLTGRHPYLLQALLEKVWEDQVIGLDRIRLSHLARELVKEHYDFQRWMETFDKLQVKIYSCLNNTAQGSMKVHEIQATLEQEILEGIDEALTVLSYHGLIDLSDPDEPRIAGSIFRDWFRRNYPNIEKRDTKKISAGSEMQEGTIPFASPIHLEFKPNIEVRSESKHYQMTRHDAAQLIDELISISTSLDLDSRAQLRAKHELEKAGLEIRTGECETSPGRTRAVEAIEAATSTLRSAGAGVEALRSFVEKASKLAPYVGRSADWLNSVL